MRAASIGMMLANQAVVTDVDQFFDDRNVGQLVAPRSRRFLRLLSRLPFSRAAFKFTFDGFAKPLTQIVETREPFQVIVGKVRDLAALVSAERHPHRCVTPEATASWLRLLPASA